MTLDDIPIFAMIRGKLDYLAERQRVIAENVANSDTPGYAPHDLKPFTIAQSGMGQAALGMAAVEPAQTSAMHMAGSIMRPKAPFKAQKTADSETTLDGNSVVLEEEMMKLTQSRMDYDAAVSMYQKSLDMLRLAIRKPGG